MEQHSPEVARIPHTAKQLVDSIVLTSETSAKVLNIEELRFNIENTLLSHWRAGYVDGWNDNSLSGRDKKAV